MKRPLKIGTQLLIARRDMNEGKGITLAEVSKETGVMEHTISSIEKNKGNPKLETILKLVNHYGYELRIV
jgi:transcriptional regulator with XRE-family HTH domain